MSIGQRLKRARELADLPARELDRLAGKTGGHAGLIEARPHSDVLSKTLAAYADVLDISLDWLVRDKEPPPVAEQVRAAVQVARENWARADQEAKAAKERARLKRAEKRRSRANPSESPPAPPDPLEENLPKRPRRPRARTSSPPSRRSSRSPSKAHAPIAGAA